jgi:hypothetical protein
MWKKWRDFVRLSLLNADYISKDKGGAPVYISEVVECGDLHDLAAYCLAYPIAISVFENNYRKGDNWYCADVMAFDFDDGKTTWVAISNALKNENLNHCIIASTNHLIDKDDGNGVIERFHVFIPFKKTVVDPELYPFIALELCKGFNFRCDEGSTKDKCRYYFKHKEPLEIFEDGNNLNVDEFAKQLNLKKRLDEMREIERKRNYKTQSTESGVAAFKQTHYFRMLTDELNCDGNRYGKASSIIGAMKKCGVELSDALSLFDQYASYGKSFTRESICRRWNQFN